jgi:hypothetical protein
VVWRFSAGAAIGSWTRCFCGCKRGDSTSSATAWRLPCLASQRTASLARVGALAAGPPADPVALARTVANNVVEKHHPLLSEELLALHYATGRLDAPGAAALAARSG